LGAFVKKNRNGRSSENRQATQAIVATPVGKNRFVFLILDKFLVFKEKTFIFALSNTLMGSDSSMDRTEVS
jgi:hypothetical protein